jgi:hypothetical protein
MFSGGRDVGHRASHNTASMPTSPSEFTSLSSLPRDATPRSSLSSSPLRADPSSAACASSTIAQEYVDPQFASSIITGNTGTSSNRTAGHVAASRERTELRRRMSAGRVETVLKPEQQHDHADVRIETLERSVRSLEATAAGVPESPSRILSAASTAPGFASPSLLPPPPREHHELPLAQGRSRRRRSRPSAADSVGASVSASGSTCDPPTASVHDTHSKLVATMGSKGMNPSAASPTYCQQRELLQLLHSYS